METIIRIAELLGVAIAASWITRILTIRSRVRQEQADTTNSRKPSMTNYATRILELNEDGSVPA